MLKTNVKKFRDNVLNWILSNVNLSDYDNFQNVPENDIDSVCNALYTIAKLERRYIKYNSDIDMLIDWMQGLPSALYTLDLLGYDVITIVCNWKECTEAEHKKDLKRYENSLDESIRIALYFVAREIIKHGKTA